MSDGISGTKPKCDNRWHWDLTWMFPYCPTCESRERSPEAKALAERVTELEARLAVLRPIARAAVLETEAQDERECAILSGKTSKLDWSRYPLAREARQEAVAALPPEERERILKEE